MDNIELPISEGDWQRVLIESGFVPDTIGIESVPTDSPRQMHQGMMLALATKARGA